MTTSGLMRWRWRHLDVKPGDEVLFPILSYRLLWRLFVRCQNHLCGQLKG